MASNWSDTGPSRLNRTNDNDDTDTDITKEDVVHRRFGGSTSSLTGNRETTLGVAEVRVFSHKLNI